VRYESPDYVGRLRHYARSLYRKFCMARLPVPQKEGDPINTYLRDTMQRGNTLRPNQIITLQRPPAAGKCETTMKTTPPDIRKATKKEHRS
jgi:hypothetical protein